MLTKRFAPLLVTVLLAIAGTVEPVLADESGVVQGPSSKTVFSGAAFDRAGSTAALERSLAEKGGFLPSLGNWFDPSSVGWGLDIQAVGDLIFAVWFTYLADGSPVWYIIVGELQAKGDGMTLTGNIDSFKWDEFGTPGNQATATTVGTMTIDWSDENNAAVSWTLNGNDNGADITYVPFASGIAFSNLTGHYFPFFAPGWGFTLLTQGDVTVLTMYWYKDGQPVWAQGVSLTPGFNMTIALAYFTGPGLCPECLSKQIEKGFSTEALTDVNIFWSPGAPPDALITWPGAFGKGPGPLGPDPFSDIPLDFGAITASAITSAYGDNFDPDYQEFGAEILGLGLGTDCLPFAFDNGSFTADLSGTFSIAWFELAPTPDGGLPVFMDENCTQPFNFFSPFDSAPAQSVLMGAGTSDAGDKASFIFNKAITVSWGAKWEDVFDAAKQSICDLSEGLSASGWRGSGPDKLSMRLYGVTRGERIECEDGYIDYFPIYLAPRPSGVDISNGSDDYFFAGDYGVAQRLTVRNE